MYSNYAKIRDEKGLKDSDVCKGAGIPQGTMSDWKKGRYDLKTDKIAKIAAFLDVPIEAIVGTQAKADGYYVYGDTAKIAQKVFDDPNLRILFDAAADASQDDIRMAADLLARLKRTNHDG